MPSSAYRASSSGIYSCHHLPVMPRLQASVHAVIAKSLEGIPPAREYHDVFPDVLLGLPPDRAIRFKIELQPGTAPILEQLV
jgi:hypothetical protein